MTLPQEFLHALGQALATMSLYKAGHPAWERAIDRAFFKLDDLLTVHPRPSFTFLRDEVILGDRSLREARGWAWGPRLADIGIQRIEVPGPVTREGLEGFLDDLFRELDGRGPRDPELDTGRTGFRVGRITVGDSEGGTESAATGSSDHDGDVPTPAIGLTEEVGAVQWMEREVAEGRAIPILEVESVVRSMAVTMSAGREALLPLVRLKDFDQYTATHSLNVAVLSMALAEHMGAPSREVQAIGIAGILHDLGKTRTPKEILNKPGRLSDEERAIMNLHPEDGAKIILEAGRGLELPAVIAYEHHIRPDGKGYPAVRFPRRCHPASDLLHVCDVYDALATNRPYRDAWEPKRILKIIQEGAGPEFDPTAVRAFVELMRLREPRLSIVQDLDHPVLDDRGHPHRSWPAPRLGRTTRPNDEPERPPRPPAPARATLRESGGVQGTTTSDTAPPPTESRPVEPARSSPPEPPPAPVPAPGPVEPQTPAISPAPPSRPSGPAAEPGRIGLGALWDD